MFATSLPDDHRPDRRLPLQLELGAATPEMLARGSNRSRFEEDVRDARNWPRPLVHLWLLRWQPSGRDFQLSKIRSEHHNSRSHYPATHPRKPEALSANRCGKGGERAFLWAPPETPPGTSYFVDMVAADVRRLSRFSLRRE